MLKVVDMVLVHGYLIIRLQSRACIAAALTGPHTYTCITRSRPASYLVLSPQASSSTTLRFHATNRYLAPGKLSRPFSLARAVNPSHVRNSEHLSNPHSTWFPSGDWWCTYSSRSLTKSEKDVSTREGPAPIGARNNRHQK